MRHSSLELTGRYTKPRTVDIEGAASRRPSLRPTEHQTEGVVMSGTDGPIGHRQPSDSIVPVASDTEKSGMEGQPISEHLGHHLATVGDVSGRDVSHAGVITVSKTSPLTNENP